jgi:hypothetical protein
MAKIVKTVKRVTAANKQALASAKDTVKRPAQRGEIFGASLPRSEPTHKLVGGAIVGKPPARGSR